MATILRSILIGITSAFAFWLLAATTASADDNRLIGDGSPCGGEPSASLPRAADAIQSPGPLDELPRPDSTFPPDSRGLESPSAAPLTPFSQGLGGMPFGGGMNSGGPGYKDLWMPNEPVRGQTTDLGMVEQDLSLAAPVWRDGPDGVLLTTNVRWEIFQTAAILPDSLRPFPQDLWNIRFGTTYNHLFDNGWAGGATVNAGSASDQPFHSTREATEMAMAFLRVPQGEHNAWLFTLMYSTNSQVLYNLPIPGVAYFYAPSEAFQATLGFPFATMKYRPDKQWRLDFSYGLLTSIHTRATYQATSTIEGYAGFDWLNESYLLADRTEDNERFYYYEKRLATGVQLAVTDRVKLDLSSGYCFDRYYFQTTGTGMGFQLTGPDRVDVGNGPFVMLQLNARFN